MAVSPKFATGAFANAMCDICGIRCKYLALRPTTRMGHLTGLLACPVCWDKENPQSFLPKFVQNDPQALRNPRPDTGLRTSRELYPPGNWINGQPPSAVEREKAALVIEAEHLRQRAIFRLQEEQQRTRKRSF